MTADNVLKCIRVLFQVLQFEVDILLTLHCITPLRLVLELNLCSLIIYDDFCREQFSLSCLLAAAVVGCYACKCCRVSKRVYKIKLSRVLEEE
jgi:hypothetical protein